MTKEQQEVWDKLNKTEWEPSLKPVEGMLYTDVDTGELFIYDGNEWKLINQRKK